MFKSETGKYNIDTDLEERQALLVRNPIGVLRIILQRNSARRTPEKLSYVLSYCNFWNLPEDLRTRVVEVLTHYDTAAGVQTSMSVLGTDIIDLEWLRYENLKDRNQIHCKDTENYFKNLHVTSADTEYRFSGMTIKDLRDLFVVKLNNVITLYPRKNFVTADGKVIIRNVLYRFKLTDVERDFYYKVSCYLRVKKDFESIKQRLFAARESLTFPVTDYFYGLSGVLEHCGFPELLLATNDLCNRIEWYDSDSLQEYVDYIPVFLGILEQYINDCEQEFGTHLDIDTATFYAQRLSGKIMTGRALYGELYEYPSELIPEF